MVNLYNVYQGMSEFTYVGQVHSTFLFVIEQSTKTETVLTERTVCNIMTNVYGSTSDYVDRVYQLYVLFSQLNGDTSGNVWNDYWLDIKSVSTGNLKELGSDG